MTETSLKANLSRKQRQEPRPPLTPLAMALAVSMARDGYTRLDLAEETGVSKSAISRILQEETNSTKSVRQKLLVYLQERNRLSLLVTEPWEVFLELMPPANKNLSLSHVENGLKGLLPEVKQNMLRQAFGFAALADDDPNDTATIKRYFELLRLARDEQDGLRRTFILGQDDWHKIARAFRLLVVYAQDQQDVEIDILKERTRNTVTLADQWNAINKLEKVVKKLEEKAERQS